MGPPTGDGQLILVPEGTDQKPHARQDPNRDQHQQAEMHQKPSNTEVQQGNPMTHHDSSSLRKRRMFQIITGTTAIMMKRAMVLPRPESPPPRNIQSNIILANTSVPHCPLVIAKTISKILRTM